MNGQKPATKGAENQQVVLKISTLVFVLTINVLVTIFEKRVLKISTFAKKYYKNQSDNNWRNKCSGFHLK
jgi:hypothetical protein